MKLEGVSHCLVSSPIDCSEKWGPEFDFFVGVSFFFSPMLLSFLGYKNEMAYVKAELLTAVFHLFYREAIFIVCL